LNKILNVEVSDTTGDDSSTSAKYKKNKTTNYLRASKFLKSNL
jgi:hypothetical protein